MSKQPHAQTTQDTLGNRGGQVVVHKGHHLHGGGSGQVQAGQQQQSIRLPNDQVGVHDGADQEGRHQLEGGPC